MHSVSAVISMSTYIFRASRNINRYNAGYFKAFL